MVNGELAEIKKKIPVQILICSLCFVLVEMDFFIGGIVKQRRTRRSSQEADDIAAEDQDQIWWYGEANFSVCINQ